MKKILNLAWNDIKIEFSDRSTLLFFFILPLVFTAILGASFGGNGDPEGDRRYTLPIVDLDQSDTSRWLISELQSSDVVRVAIVGVEEADPLLQSGEVSTYLVIPNGFEKDLLSDHHVSLELKKSPSDPNVILIEQAIRTASSRIAGTINISTYATLVAEEIRPFPSYAEKQVYFNESLSLAKKQLEHPLAQSTIKFAPEAQRTYFNAFELSSAGQLVTWTLITLLGASEVFVNERTSGTLRRLFASPASKTIILSGKVTARLVMGLVQMTVLIVIGGLLFKVNWGQSSLALAMVVIPFALAAVAIGVMLGAFSKTRSQASGLTVMVSMVMAALGGAWWQLEITPPLYQKFVQILPSTWAMKGFNQVIVKGSNPEDLFLVTIVLMSFAIFFFLIGIWKLERIEN